MKKGEFQCNFMIQRGFKLLKKKATDKLVLSLPNFGKVFEVDCDANITMIGSMLTQEDKPISFFNEKLNVLENKYSMYDQDFYTKS
jgi:hypothetical protein